MNKNQKTNKSNKKKSEESNYFQGNVSLDKTKHKDKDKQGKKKRRTTENFRV